MHYPAAAWDRLVSSAGNHCCCVRYIRFAGFGKLRGAVSARCRCDATLYAAWDPSAAGAIMRRYSRSHLAGCRTALRCFTKQLLSPPAPSVVAQEARSYRRPTSACASSTQLEAPHADCLAPYCSIRELTPSACRRAIHSAIGLRCRPELRYPCEWWQKRLLSSDKATTGTFDRLPQPARLKYYYVRAWRIYFAHACGKREMDFHWIGPATPGANTRQARWGSLMAPVCSTRRTAMFARYDIAATKCCNIQYTAVCRQAGRPMQAQFR